MKKVLKVYCISCKNYIYTEQNEDKIGRLEQEIEDGTNRNSCKKCATAYLKFLFKKHCGI